MKVPTLETCKKLKEAGFDVETERVWEITSVGTRLAFFNILMGDRKEYILAPDMQELWGALPLEGIEDKECKKMIWIHPYKYSMTCAGYLDTNLLPGGEGGEIKDNTNPAEALAQLWLWVKENHPEAL